MSLGDEAGSDGRFSSYVERLASVIGHADRVNPMAMAPGSRKVFAAFGIPLGTIPAVMARG